MYVIVIGAGKIGYYITKTLLEEAHEVLLVEKDSSQYNRVYEELGEAVFLGDGDELRVLEEIGSHRADVFIAVTGEDEDNLVACQLAKRRFHVPRVIARVNNPKNEEIFRRLGIDATVSSTQIIYNLLEQEMAVPDVLPLMTLKKSNFEIVEVCLLDSSPVFGKKVQDLNLPTESLLIAVVRDNQVLIPKGDTILQGRDSIIALISKGEERHLQEILVGT